MFTAHPNNSYSATPTSSGSRRCAAVGVRSVTKVTRHGVHLGMPFDHYSRLGRSKARHSSAFSRLSVHAELVGVAPLCFFEQTPSHSGHAARPAFRFGTRSSFLPRTRKFASFLDFRQSQSSAPPNRSFNSDPAATVCQTLVMLSDFSSPSIIRPAAGPVNLVR